MLGNISSISDPIQGTRTYTYDAQGQMTKEVIDGTTYSYTYDKAGNLLTGRGHTYTYGNSTWGDLLTKFDGETISYDTIGNPTSYYNGTRWTFGWENGRQLVSASGGGKSISYVYDQTSGLRLSKTVDGVTHTYIYEGDKLMRLTIGSDVVMDFFYDHNGQPYAVNYNGTKYYYVLNLQGDVVKIVTAAGNSCGTYTYDAWGNILYTSDNQYLKNNPLRYRGYVYDTETELYYCQSRYYDPEVGRFINADSFASTGQGILGNNMFAYCGNNPVNFCDPSGQKQKFWFTLFDDHQPGYVHRLVQLHILSVYNVIEPIYTKEYYLADIGRADIVNMKTREAWEIKHGGSTWESTERGINNALNQVEKYIGVSTGLHPGAAGTFQGFFTIQQSDRTYAVIYLTPDAGVILYYVLPIENVKKTDYIYVSSKAKEKSSGISPAAFGFFLFPVGAAGGIHGGSNPIQNIAYGI